MIIRRAISFWVLDFLVLSTLANSLSRVTPNKPTALSK